MGGVNLLINGGFDIWQRGTSFLTSGTNGYTADRWLVSASQPTKVERVINTCIDSLSKYACRITLANSYNIFCQPLENFDELVEKTVTLSFWVKGSVAMVSQFNFGGDAGYGVFNITTQWKKIVLTKKMKAGSVARQRGIGFSSTALNLSGQSIEMADVKLELGEIATPYIPENETTELLKCQRYYETGQNVSAFTDYLKVFLSGINYRIEKRIAPTVTIGAIFITATGQVLTHEGVAHEVYNDNKKIALVRNFNTSQIFNVNTMYIYNYIADAEIH